MRYWWYVHRVIRFARGRPEKLWTTTSDGDKLLWKPRIVWDRLGSAKLVSCMQFSHTDYVIYYAPPFTLTYCLQRADIVISGSHPHVRPSVCLSVCNVGAPYSGIEIFGNVSTPCGALASRDLCMKIYGDRPRGTPPSRELNTRGI